MLASFSADAVLAKGDDGSFALTSAETKAGSEFTVELSVKDSTGLAGFQIEIEYDSSVFTLQNAEAVDYNDVVLGNTENEPFTVLWMDAYGTHSDQNGTFARLTFKTADDAAAGVYEMNVTFDSDNILDLSLEPLDFGVENAAVTVKDNRKVTELTNMPTGTKAKTAAVTDKATAKADVTTKATTEKETTKIKTTTTASEQKAESKTTKKETAATDESSSNDGKKTTSKGTKKADEPTATESEHQTESATVFDESGSSSSTLTTAAATTTKAADSATEKEGKSSTKMFVAIAALVAMAAAVAAVWVIVAKKKK
ncbi:MAG: hypothetical protein J6O40_02025 [Ruminococcus sp.]|nr:hypothetical protein [Ruminococcus sp.]